MRPLRASRGSIMPPSAESSLVGFPAAMFPFPPLSDSPPPAGGLSFSVGVVVGVAFAAVHRYFVVTRRVHAGATRRVVVAAAPVAVGSRVHGRRRTVGGDHVGLIPFLVVHDI